jgi:carbonic anhydrase
MLLSTFGVWGDVSNSITVAHNKPLDYASDWCTDPEWLPNTCCGPLQSPIDIRSADVAKTVGQALGVTTKVVPETKLVLTSNGVELEMEGPFFELEYNGITYTAEQLHFHSPSEHVIDGFYCAGEMHAVVNSPNEDHAVLAFCLQMGVEPNEFTVMVNNILQQADASWDTTMESDWESAPVFDVSASSFSGVMDASYVSYMGSYTTPSCTLDVQWFFFATPVSVDPTFIEFMQRRFRQPANHRPLQELELPNRQLKLIEVCDCTSGKTRLFQRALLVSALPSAECECPSDPVF